jgi:hypothetical protein
VQWLSVSFLALASCVVDQTVKQLTVSFYFCGVDVDFFPRFEGVCQGKVGN